MSDELRDTLAEAYDAANAEAAEDTTETTEESEAAETTAEESSTSETAESTETAEAEAEAAAEESPRIPKERLDQVIGQRDLYKQLYEETLTKPAAKTETETETTDQPDEFTALFEAFEPATKEEARLYKMNLALHGQITQITKALDSVAPLLEGVLQKSQAETLHSQAMDQFNGTIGELETQLGTKFSDEDKQAILSKASTLGNMDVRSATLQGFILTKNAPAAKKTDPRADILKGKDNLPGKGSSSAPAPGAKAVSGDMDLKEALAETARELGIKTR
jgi:hypothetical protein